MLLLKDHRTVLPTTSTETGFLGSPSTVASRDFEGSKDSLGRIRRSEDEGSTNVVESSAILFTYDTNTGHSASMINKRADGMGSGTHCFTNEQSG